MNLAFVATLFTTFNNIPDEDDERLQEEIPITAAVVAASEDIQMIEKQIGDPQNLFKQAEQKE